MSASQKRHERIEELLDPQTLHSRTALEDVALALGILLEESVVQAQRLDMIEAAFERHTHAYLRPRANDMEFPFEAKTTPPWQAQ